MRKHAKKDENHKKIVDALVKVGCVCFDTSMMGNGFPDALVWFCGHYYLMEFKVPTGKKTKAQIEFHEKCKRNGITIHIVKTWREAFKVVGVGI
jgi:hypothetical protein